MATRPVKCGCMCVHVCGTVYCMRVCVCVRVYSKRKEDRRERESWRRMVCCVCGGERERGKEQAAQVQFPSLLFTPIDYSLSDRREETAPQPAAVSLCE